MMVEGREAGCSRSPGPRNGRRCAGSRAGRRLVFASGAEAFLYSGANPDGLRGPEHHIAWCDELAKWRQAEAAWDNLAARPQAGRAAPGAGDDDSAAGAGAEADPGDRADGA